MITSILFLMFARFGITFDFYWLIFFISELVELFIDYQIMNRDYRRYVGGEL